MTRGSYEERHVAALDVFDGFLAGEIDAERAARAMHRRHGALGSFAVDVVMGDVWCRPQLSRRDRSLIVLAALATQGSTEELSLHVQIGLNHGLTRIEIDEVILHVAGYAGFPRAMQATRIVDDRYCQIDGVERLDPKPPAAGKSREQRRADANDVRRTMTAGRADPDPEVDLALLVEHLGDVGLIAYEWAFGDLWARVELSRRDRSLVVIAILTTLSKEAELAFHVPAGLHHGLTREEIEEIMVQMCIYGGLPRAVEGIRAAKAAFAKIDARS